MAAMKTIKKGGGGLNGSVQHRLLQADRAKDHPLI
jgi:hypothetical protein